MQIRLERVNSYVELSVSDTGMGFAPEFLPHVFERFRQGDAGIARAHGGLGLGLSIAKQLSEMHGGTIEAASGGLGTGATFRLKLPLMIVHPTRDESERVDPAITLWPRFHSATCTACTSSPSMTMPMLFRCWQSYSTPRVRR